MGTTVSPQVETVVLDSRGFGNSHGESSLQSWHGNTFPSRRTRAVHRLSSTAVYPAARRITPHARPRLLAAACGIHCFKFGGNQTLAMTITKTQAKRKLLTWLPVLSPTLLLLIFLTLAAHVRISLGHWPKPMWEHYWTTNYALHAYAFMGLSLFTVYAAVPLWLLLLLCFRQLRISWATHLVQAGTYALGWGLIGAYAAWDPGHFLAWWLD